jgi:putative endonuclease
MRDQPFCVYIMTNRTRGVLYTGVTNEIARRVVEHRLGRALSFTTRYNVNRLVWFEPHDDITAAIKREKLIKRWRRDWKFALIEKDNPGWSDLARDFGL